MKGLYLEYSTGSEPLAFGAKREDGTHRACRIVYIVQGRMLIRGHGAVVEDVGGTLSFFPPEAIGEHQVSGSAEAWALTIDLTDAEPWLREAVAPFEREHACCWHAQLDAADQLRWESRFQYLEAAPANNARHVLRGAFADLQHAMSGAAPEEAVGKAVLRFLYRHYRDAVTLTDVAAEMGYSGAYLTDRVKRETGLPVHRWLLYYRITEAKHLLRDTDLPIEQVAESVGFSSGNYFSRQFLKVTGRTPAAWRTASRERRILPEAAHRFGAPPAAWGLDLDAIIDALPQLAWVKDATGALLYANRRWFEYTGLSEDESAGWGWTAVVHPDDVAESVRQWRNAVRSRKAVDYTARIRRAADSHYRLHLFRSIPYTTQSGKTFWVGTATDVQDLESIP